MPKKKPSAILHEPLSAILGTQAKLAVLRVLAVTGVAIPFREAARRTGMAYRSVDLALSDLLATGLVEELEGGRERRVALNSGHRLAPAISALLRSESDFFPSLRTELKSMAARGEQEGLLTLALVGAVASGEERAGDLLELVFVASDPAALKRWQLRLEGGADSLGARFGVRCRVIGYDLAGARKLWQARTERAEVMVRGAETLMGSPLLQVVETI